MNYLQNHIWCSDSNLGGWYTCKHVVSLDSYSDESEDDWEDIVNDSAEYIEQRGLRGTYNRPVVNFKPEVLAWLEENVKDRPSNKYFPDGHTKGWCIGSTEYRSTFSGSLSVFFHRRKDAMAFIRRWSKWKKPVMYTQYFSDVRKKLNLTTLKYENN